MNSNFIIGDPYFMFRFLDKEFRYPVITSIVFLGKNIEEDGDNGDLWFFQDAESYYHKGAYDGTGKEVDDVFSSKGELMGQVYDFPEEQLESILTVQELIDSLAKV